MPKRDRCQALDMNGKRCRCSAVGSYQYHGDNELYGFCSNSKAPSWVQVRLCSTHNDALTSTNKKGK